MNDIDRLRRLYGAAGRELRRMLRGLEPTSYTAQDGVSVMRETRALVAALNEAAVRWSDSAVPRAYAKGLKTARTALEILGRKPRRPASFDSGRKLASDTAELLIRANNSIPGAVSQYLGLMATAARAYRGAGPQLQEFRYAQAASTLDAMAEKAVAEQKSRTALSARLKEYLRDYIENDNFIQIGDRMYRMSKYTELVGRTTMREAQTKATLDACEQYENDLVRVSDHGCDCDECEPYEGETYSISGRSADYPMLEDEPPFHPNCKHFLSPTSEEQRELRRERGESDLERRIREARERGETWP